MADDADASDLTAEERALLKQFIRVVAASRVLFHGLAWGAGAVLFLVSLAYYVLGILAGQHGGGGHR